MPGRNGALPASAWLAYLDADLRCGDAIANRGSIIGQRVLVDSDAEGDADLIGARVAAANAGTRVIQTEAHAMRQQACTCCASRTQRVRGEGGPEERA